VRGFGAACHSPAHPPAVVEDGCVVGAPACNYIFLYYHISAILMYYGISVLPYFCITIFLYYHISVLPYFCIIIFLYYHISVLRFFCITIFLYYHISVLPYFCIHAYLGISLAAGTVRRGRWARGRGTHTWPYTRRRRWGTGLRTSLYRGCRRRSIPARPGSCGCPRLRASGVVRHLVNGR
jgi:hypothetical protein